MTALLQTVAGDLDFSSHNLVIVSDLKTIVKQKAYDVLMLFLGEWFLDTTVGTPWFQLILGIKNPDFNIIRSAIRSRLLAIDGVSAVQDVLFNWNPKARTLNYSVNLALANGLTITITPPPPLP